MSNTTHISIPIPQFLSEEEKELFQQQATYQVTKPRIKTLKRVFVTHDGLVMKNGFLVDGCAFNLKPKNDHAFYFPFWKKTIEQFAVCKWGKSLKSIKLKGPKKYLLIHSPWFNYSFWINSFLPRLIEAEEAGHLQSCKLIVPENWKKIPYVWESLSCFKVEHEVVPEGTHLFVDRLIMPETRRSTATFYPPRLQNTRSRLVTEALKRTVSQKFPRKIYLTRSIRGVRCVKNETEVVHFLESKGYQSIAFEKLSFWEQIALMNGATHFVSMHGAGFANILFMKKNNTAIEFLEHDFAQYNNPFPFWKMAAATGVIYNALLCDSDQTDHIKHSTYTAKKRMNLVNRTVSVSISALTEKLKQIDGASVT